MMRVRRTLLFLVMLGALSLSFNGQVESVAPQLGLAFAVVFALSYDVATLLALHEVTTPGTSRRLRSWAWLVLIQAGGTALGLNTWHGLTTGKLPSLAAIAVGAGPVTLAWTLSHLIALALAERSGRAGRTAPGIAPAAPPAGTTPAAPEPVPDNPGGAPAPPADPGSTRTGPLSADVGGDDARRAGEPGETEGPDRAGEPIPAGMGRRRLARELGTTEYAARKMLLAARTNGAAK